MAASLQAPDPKTFSRWEDAFAYPIPAVRRMETQLRADVAANRERLRSLVGGSYRDLLGTADAIVDMDARMRAVEARVALIGRRCNAGLLERSRDRSRDLLALPPSATGGRDGGLTGGAARKTTAAAPAAADYALASRLAVFKACADVIARILRRGGSLLAAAKVLVLSRILYRKLKEAGGRFEKAIESAFLRLGRIRSRLLDAIENRLGMIPIETEALLDAMSAYALATTSSTADILRHFLRTRATWVLRHMHDSEESRSDPVQALRTWLQTLRDTPLVFPRQFSQTLNKLKASPLLSGEDVQAIALLELDIHQNWLGDDVVSFVPYVRHDDLDISAAKKELSTWAPLAFASYLKELNKHLATSKILSDVAKTRRECLTAWFIGNNRIAGIERSDVLGGLRKAFSGRLSSLAIEKCNALKEISKDLHDTLDMWSEDTAVTLAPKLWESDMVNMDVSHGAKPFTRNLQHSLKGHTRAVDQPLREYRRWKHEIQDVENVIQEQRKNKWQDLTDDFDEDYDEEESRDRLLSREDPDLLEKIMEEAVSSAINAFAANLAQISSELAQGGSGSEKSAFLLRFGREAITALPASYKQTFDAKFLAQLHGPLAVPIVTHVLAKNRKSIISSLSKQRLVIRPLWNEKTDLPVLPSPWAVKLIRDCHNAMTHAGTDLWTASCCAELKRSLGEELTSALSTSQPTNHKNREAGSSDRGDVDDQESPVQDTLTQRLFDTFYLREALRPKNESQEIAEGWQNHVEWLKGQIKLEDEKQEQIQSDAAAYWKRTSLLFALLA